MYELIESDKTVNDMFILGLKFYKTHRENVFITNYDALNPENNLVKKDLLLLIRTDNYRNSEYISKELLNNKLEVINIIDSL